MRRAAAKYPELAGLDPVLVGPSSDLVVFVPAEVEGGIRSAWEDGRSITTTVVLRLELVDGHAGGYAPVSFRVDSDDGRALTAEVIRALKISDTFAMAATNLLPTSRLARLTPKGRGIREVDVSRLALDDDDRACLAYTEAKLTGRDTNRAVAAEVDVTPAAAAQRVRRLRLRGLLPPATGQGARRS